MVKNVKQKYISVSGTRVHNLQNLSVKIPRDKLVVITGISGSGKSSLAFDTIFAEGQRRYMESLSAYARQFLETMDKPDVDYVSGLSPAISIEQKNSSNNPRSTVGTVTEIYDYMRLLWARAGVPHSPATGLPIESQTVSQMVDKLCSLDNGIRGYILAPLAKNQKGEFKKQLAELLKDGFQRVIINGDIYLIEDAPALDKNKKHNIDVIVDRIITNDQIAERLADSLETALKVGNQVAMFQPLDKQKNILTKKQIVFSQKFACPVSGFTLTELEPRIFSFNSPQGACESCHGIGYLSVIDPDLVIPNPNISINNGAIEPWSNNAKISEYYAQLIHKVNNVLDFCYDKPWRELADSTKNILLYGKTIINGKSVKAKAYEGVIPNLTRRWRHNESERHKQYFEKYLVEKTCSKCKGFRLRDQALSVLLDNKNIGEVTTFSVVQAYKWFLNLENKLTKTQQIIAAPIVKEVIARLKFLTEVGLDYLNISRPSKTLSGGEAQRIRLASQIGSGLQGVLYVLDEPSIGLHQRDNDRLLKTLYYLRDLGNSIIVVEHDEETMRAADHIIDIGPLAGTHGGKLVAQGQIEKICNSNDSITGKYLTGQVQVYKNNNIRKPNWSNAINLIGCTGNNLKNIDVSFPLGLFTCVTGVSGSGKSTLLIETLFGQARRHLGLKSSYNASYHKINGLEQVDKVINIDQSPIGRTPRSNPATYIGVFTKIREWYSALPESQARGYKPGRFSFNVKGGRCEACKGDGLKLIEMHFMADVYVECAVCKGKRFGRETLEVKFKEKSIADVLDMTVDDGAEYFGAVPSIKRALQVLQKVGLGYIKIGQPATTLSGGEAQRIKLAKELSKRSTGSTLYILDEPTTGLHFYDISKLLECLHLLVDQGNTVITVEHNLDFINTADWIIDMGPEGGAKGGELVAKGPPNKMDVKGKSYTNEYLNRMADLKSK